MKTKDFILQELELNNPEPVSGQTLADKAHISRAAIWKAITALRKEGFEIEGSPKTGYVLKGQDILSSEAVHDALVTLDSRNETVPVTVFKEINSTNTWAKQQLSASGSLRDKDGNLTADGKKWHKACILAESQTAGKGRLGRQFISPAKTGLYLTVVYAPQGGITQPALLTATTAVAVVRAIKKLYHTDSRIKWINDIFINEKKVCGILAEGFTNFETNTIEASIIGIGINIELKEENLSPEVLKVAGSILPQGTKNTVSRSVFAAEIIHNMFTIFEEDVTAVMEEYKSLSLLQGRTITVYPVIDNQSSAYEATVTGIDNEARLLVTLKDGSQKALSSGEVTLHSSQIK